MKVRNILSGALALAVSATAATVIASAEVPADGVLFLGIADNDWKINVWGAEGDSLDSSYLTTATLNGNGTYTVGIDLSSGFTVDGWVDEDTGDLLELTTGNSIGAMGVHVMGEYPATMGADIISVKVDGSEIPVSGTSFADTESGGRRMHVYNEWANYNADSDDHATSDAASATGTVIDKGDVGEWTSIEVTFTVYGLEDNAPAAAEAPAAEEAPAATEAASTEAQA
ncbi:MAG: hypothetical protein NC202_12405, partial [Roseburia sp.]|nr:hypothetical protein [Roseburia sp.]